MNLNSVEIVLVEDNPTDAELTIRALKKYNLANNLIHVKNGADALDFIFGTGSIAENQGGSPDQINARGSAYFFQRKPRHSGMLRFGSQ
jgi:hypothetical protein